MTPPRRPAEIAAIVGQALQEEAEARLAAGEELVGGVWMPAAQGRSARRAGAWRALLGTVEALLYWGAVASAGLALLALVTVIL